MKDIPVQCTRCRHQCMESNWLNKPVRTTGSISMSQKVCPKCGCKSYFDISPQVAWCWANGVIEIGDTPPEKSANSDGPIVIATGPKSDLKGALCAVARHGKMASEGRLLVPGVPEAKDQMEALDALDTWLSWCAKSNGKKHRHGVCFVPLTKGAAT